MKSKLLASMLLLVIALPSYAEIVSTQNARYRVDDPGWPSCEPGVAPNGHNYPTSSALIVFRRFDLELGVSNIDRLYAPDPASRLGDHCTELLAEFAAFVPGEMRIAQTFRRSTEPRSGGRVQIWEESIEATFGKFAFYGGESFSVPLKPRAPTSSQTSAPAP
jgi:hypothetical protein